MFKKFFHLLLFDLFILSTIRPPDLCLSMSASFQNLTNYNPLIELKLFQKDNILNSLADKKKNYYKSDHLKKDANELESSNELKSRAKEYLQISEIPPVESHSAYSVVHRTGNQVMVNPILAKKVGISTLVAGTLFYSFTILPLILMLTGTGPFHDYGPLIRRRRKRSIKEKRYANYFKYGTEHLELPLLSKFESNKFIKLFENSLELKKIQYPICKKLYFCKIYNHVLKKNEKPTTYYTFEDALINVLGIAVEKTTNSKDFINECKFYYEPALIGISGQDCENFYHCKTFDHIKFN